MSSLDKYSGGFPRALREIARGDGGGKGWIWSGRLRREAARFALLAGATRPPYWS